MNPFRRLGSPCSAALLALLLAPASAQTTSLESVSSLGAKGDLSSWRPTLSEDGRYVAFHSLATNLVEGGDHNGFRDIYVHDHQTGATERISWGPAGQETDGDSRDATISEDGRFVAFYSDATNLVAGDTNGARDGFLHDRQAGTTVRFSVDVSGQQADADVGGSVNGLTRGPSISEDGNLIAFHGKATNLVPGGTNGMWQVFVKDMLTGVVTLASPGVGSTGGDGDSYIPCLAANGLLVTFESAATDLVAGDTNGFEDVFVFELSTAQNELISLPFFGPHGDQRSGWPAISGDGSLVVFQSAATNLVPLDINGHWDTFARDRLALTTELISVSSWQRQGDRASGAPSVSKDGRHVAFMSEASTFDPGDTNGLYDIYLRDRVVQTTEWLSLSSTGVQPDEKSELPCIAANGNQVAFQSPSDDLVPDDFNGAWDIFLRHPTEDCNTTIATYCTASTTSIPGCQAMISNTLGGPPGLANLCDPSGFLIGASPTPGQSIGLCFFGVSGPAAIPFGTQGGLICVKPPLLRSVPRWSGGTSGACDGTLTFSLDDLKGGNPNALQVGATVHVQVWFRDPASPDGYGLSNAMWFQTCCRPCTPPNCPG